MIERGAEVDACAAAALGDVKRLAATLKDGLESPMELNPRGLSPLHWAVIMGQLNTAKILVDAGAGIDARGQYESTPLCCSVRRSREEMAKWLISVGADVNARNHAGSTPLFVAASWARPGLAKLFLNAGADPDLVLAGDGPFGGYTALHWAAERGHAAVVRVLIAHGANTDIADARGETPLQRAEDNNQPETARILLDHGANRFSRESVTPRQD